MKTTKELNIWSLRMVLFTILLSGLSVQKVYSFVIVQKSRCMGIGKKFMIK